MKIGILGTGNVGRTIAEGLLRARHEIRLGSRKPAGARAPKGASAGPLPEVVRWAEVVVLAIPYTATEELLKTVGASPFSGKIVIDARNALGPAGGLAVGHTTSAAEDLARALPGARVVKAFNTVFAPHMGSGKLGRDTLTLFVAGDDPAAKKIVMGLGSDLGFEPVDAGGLSSARYLEPMAMLLITLGYRLKMGTSIGFRLAQG